VFTIRKEIELRCCVPYANGTVYTKMKNIFTVLLLLELFFVNLDSVYLFVNLFNLFTSVFIYLIIYLSSTLFV